MSENSTLLEAYQHVYAELVKAAIDVLEEVPGTISDEASGHDRATLALLKLAAALEAGRDSIRQALDVK